MTESRKESLSALIDGEASEIEVHRLVREFRDDQSLSRTWAVYQQIRTTVQAGRETGPVLTADEHLTLLDRINTAVEQEDTFEKAKNPASKPTRILAGSLALAASLVVAVFIGVQQSTLAPAPSASGVATVDPGSQRPGQPLEVMPASNQASYAQAGPTQTLQSHELVELDEEKQRRLRAYLNQHDRMARMSPNTQLVNYKEGAGN